ncbi:MAG TPA: hypothetical protein EYG68_01045 [Leucothrix mucor]|nr:hypothetical protein [Leucothrix mucor]
MQSSNPKKLFNLPILLLIVIVLLFLLLALFPWKTAEYLTHQNANILKEQFSSRLKTEYHQMLKIDKPINSDLLKLAKSLREKGLWNHSTLLLNKKINLPLLNSQQQRQFNLTLLYNYVDAYHAPAKNNNEKHQLKINVRHQLQQLEELHSFSNSELQTLAELSADFGLLPLANKLYYRLADTSMRHRSQWFAEAGKQSNQAEDYFGAARAFKLASESSKQETLFNEYTENWLTALINTGQLDQVELFLNDIEQQLPVPSETIEALANICIQAGFFSKASNFFSYLAKHDANDQQRWYEKASYWASKAGNYENAIEHLVNAEKITNTDSEKWFIKQRLIDVYVKAEMPDQALEIILPMIDSNPQNFKLINQAINISLSNKNLSVANKLNKTYLAQNPNSLNALNLQVNIEASDKKYKQAISYIKRVVSITPNELTPRERWADLEEKEGNHDLATDLWQWIYKYSNDKEHLQKVINIAQANIKGDGLAVLQQIALEDELPKQAAYDVFFYLVKKGQKKAGEKFLQEYLMTHKADRSLLQTLAKWYSGEKRYTQSIKTWSRLERNYGTTKTSSLNKFELYWLLRKKRQAHKLWLKNKSAWRKIANRRQLSIMAEVAWKYKHYRQALSYYTLLINKKYKRSLKERTFQYMRVALLQKKLGHPKSALKTFRKGYIKTRNPELLINGLQLSFDRHDERNFKRLTSLAKKRKSRVKSRSRYWLLQAAYAQRNKSYKTALRYYKRVLSLKPRSREARLGIKAIKKLSTNKHHKIAANDKMKPKEVSGVISQFNQKITKNYSVNINTPKFFYQKNRI